MLPTSDTWRMELQVMIIMNHNFPVLFYKFHNLFFFIPKWLYNTCDFMNFKKLFFFYCNIFDINYWKYENK